MYAFKIPTRGHNSAKKSPRGPSAEELRQTVHDTIEDYKPHLVRTWIETQFEAEGWTIKLWATNQNVQVKLTLKSYNIQKNTPFTLKLTFTETCIYISITLPCFRHNFNLNKMVMSRCVGGHCSISKKFSGGYYVNVDNTTWLLLCYIDNLQQLVCRILHVDL